MDVHNISRQAEQSGILIRPSLCETCRENKPLVKHHRDYTRSLAITWLCLSCHRKEHYSNKDLIMPGRKIIQLDTRTHGVIQREAIRQSTKPGFTVTMGGVIAQLAIQITNRRRRK